MSTHLPTAPIAPPAPSAAPEEAAPEPQRRLTSSRSGRRLAYWLIAPAVVSIVAV